MATPATFPHRLDSLLMFHRLGYSTLIIDYRGYGNSGGKPSEQGTYQDAEAAWRHLTETGKFLPIQSHCSANHWAAPSPPGWRFATSRRRW